MSLSKWVVSQVMNRLEPRYPDGCTDKISYTYAEIRALLEKSGNSIGANDLLIAATALNKNATLVTHNINEFSRVPGLNIEDWVKE